MPPILRLLDRLLDQAVGRIDWPALGTWSWRQAKRLLLIAAVVAGLIGLLYGARWSCEMNPACPWDHLYLKRSLLPGIGGASRIV
ncbi:MAG: hypothetical protein NXI19_04975 [Alphaproteobacteria bacterium]|nr:hypothetical protein [Alphaproteobacteria bacterium]